MKKASPVDMRKALEAANLFKSIGILFVPMPVLNEEDHDKLIEQMHERMDKIQAALK